MRQKSEMMGRCMRFMRERSGAGASGDKYGNPREMCRSMMEDAMKTDDPGSYATPELRALFEDWLLQLEDEIIALAKRRPNIKPEDVAEAFKISRDSASFLLDKLAQRQETNKDGQSVRKEDSDGNDG